MLSTGRPKSIMSISPTLSTTRTSHRTKYLDRPDWFWLVGLWLTVTAYNLFKPYHIDDTAHLEIAQWIQSHPLHPMSGLLNWIGIDVPIYRTRQPHLYFYVLAIWGRMFGFGELAMHALQSLAALACILLFHRLARAFAPASALWATAMLVLGPAFVVEQNLMVDVPLLAAWLAFFNPLVCDVNRESQSRRYLLAALACAAALLIKYSSIVLFLVLCLSMLGERRPAQAWTALIPLATLSAWSLFNYLDYGGVHIASLPLAHDSTLDPLRWGVAWFIGLGALTPLGLIVAVQSLPRRVRVGWAIYAAAAVAFATLVTSVAIGIASDFHSDKLLWLSFAGNSALICFALAQDAMALVRLKLWRSEIVREAAPTLYMFLWIAGTTIFYVLFSPFMAARHVLLILPPVSLLLVARWGGALTSASKVFGLALTVVISAGLCLSDWRFAAFYRSEARMLARALPKSGGVWASGHWGWQWYAEQNGLPQLDVVSTPLWPGNLLVVTDEAEAQRRRRTERLSLVRTDAETHPLLNLFCTGREARFYAYNFTQAPWSLSRACLNHVYVFRVDASASKAGTGHIR
jgi:4-amino-4-deoxy-L-arabinose transferase-like glycosyltransferase